MASVSTAGKTLYFFDGTVWIPVGGGGAPTGASVIYSGSQPDVTDLEVGTIWVDSDAEVTGGGGGGGGTGLSFWSEDNVGNLIPDSANIQNIGSLQYPVKDIFLSASSIYLGNTQVVSNGSTLIVGSNELLNSSTASTLYATKTELNNINLNSAITTASAAAYSSASAYTNAQIANINLSSAITTASAAAAAYTDSELASIDLSATIQTASAAAVSYLVDGAPAALNTLNELSAALNDDPNILNSLLTASQASATYLPLSSSASFYRWTKTYSASASVISGVDDNSISLSYNAGYIQLFINGVMLDPSEYTATSGSAITVSTPVLSGEVVDIFAFLNSTSVNTYSQAQINEKYNQYTRWKKVYTIPGNESFTVTNNGSGAYVVAGVSNPTFNLVKGNTYTFVVNASGHPFWIQTISGGYSSGNVYSTGTTNLGTASGTITWTVPTNAPDTLYYACQYHSSMQGTINLLDPAKIQGSDDNSLALSYTSGYEQVYLNGILLTPVTDYARTSASVITLGSGVITNDVIEIINTQPFNVADVYTISQSNSTFLTRSSASADYIPDSIVDAKGDIITATADNTPAKLTAGSNGQSLIVDALTSTGLNWSSGERIKQIITATSSTQTQTNTNTFVDTTLTLSITPSSINNKIILVVVQNGARKDGGNTWLNLKLLRGNTDIATSNFNFYTNDSSPNGSQVMFFYLDSPSTTSTTTYKTQQNSGNNTTGTYTQVGNATSYMYAIEVGI
jgi:hypothetical protein